MGEFTINRRLSESSQPGKGVYEDDEEVKSRLLDLGILADEDLPPRACLNREVSSDHEKDGLKENKWDYLRQMCCVLVLSFSMNIIGTAVGWSAIVPKIQSDNTTDFSLTNTDVRWLVSSIFLASIPGNLFGGSIGELVGPRRFLLLLLPATIGCWALQAFTTSLIFLHVGRICLGFVYGLVNTLVQPLVTEICEPSIRGIANVLPEIIATASILYSYLLAHFLPWRVGTALCGAVLIPTFFLTLFIPESPYWLMRRGRMKDAEKALGFILGPGRIHRRQMILKEIETSVKDQAQGSLVAQMRLFRSPQNWKPVLLVGVLIMLREASGRINIFMYTVYIFRDAGVDFNPFLCTTIVGVTRLINTIFAAILVEKVGRRMLLFTTVVTCGVVITTAGGIIATDQEFPGSQWIPLVSILIYVVSYSTGVGPITWALMGELLPSPIRSLSTSIVCISFSSSIFIINNVFLKMKDLFGLGICFIIFGMFSFLMALIVFCFLPETKGRTLLELERIFSGENKLQKNKSETSSSENRKIDY